jgi:hypothetical protein
VAKRVLHTGFIQKTSLRQAEGPFNFPISYLKTQEKDQPDISIRIMHELDHQRISKGILDSSKTLKNSQDTFEAIESSHTSIPAIGSKLPGEPRRDRFVSVTVGALASLTRILEFLLDDKCGNEAHGIRNSISFASRQAGVKELWIKCNVTFLALNSGNNP